MPIAHRSHGSVRVLLPAGRLDHENCEQFCADLRDHVAQCAGPGGGIVLDLSALDYVSSAGLRCFMLAAKQTKAANGRIVVAAMQPIVAEIFQISRFNMLFDVFPTVDAALASLGKS